jgi:hypothetical protein
MAELKLHYMLEHPKDFDTKMYNLVKIQSMKQWAISRQG